MLYHEWGINYFSKFSNIWHFKQENLHENAHFPQSWWWWSISMKTEDFVHMEQKAGELVPGRVTRKLRFTKPSALLCTLQFLASALGKTHIHLQSSQWRTLRSLRTRSILEHTAEFPQARWIILTTTDRVVHRIKKQRSFKLAPTALVVLHPKAG